MKKLILFFCLFFRLFPIYGSINTTDIKGINSDSLKFGTCEECFDYVKSLPEENLSKDILLSCDSICNTSSKKTSLTNAELNSLKFETCEECWNFLDSSSSLGESYKTLSSKCRDICGQKSNLVPDSKNKLNADSLIRVLSRIVAREPDDLCEYKSGPNCTLLPKYGVLVNILENPISIRKLKLRFEKPDGTNLLKRKVINDFYPLTEFFEETDIKAAGLKPETIVVFSHYNIKKAYQGVTRIKLSGKMGKKRIDIVNKTYTDLKVEINDFRNKGT